MILINQYIEFLIKHKLTQEQYLLLYLLKKERKDLIQAYKKNFPTKDGTMIPRSQIKDLVNKGFIIQTGTTNKSYKLANKILETFVTPEIAVDEIYSLYPPFIKSNEGVPIPLTTMDKSIFKNIYLPKIMGNVKEHKEVLLDLQYAIDKGLIKVGINKFLVSEQWKGFRKLREQETPTQIIQQEEDF